MVVCIVALVLLAGLVRTWIRAKHGLPLSDREERRTRRHRLATSAPDLAAERKITLLSDENERLTGQIGRLEERLRVLERIATDPAERTAREIDALRDR
jgi:hypothetical protein